MIISNRPIAMLWRRHRRAALVTAALAAVAALPFTAQAHRAWLMPSATVFSGSDNWVTVDAAVSNDLFYFEHMPMRIAGFPQVRIGGRGPGGGPGGGAPGAGQSGSAPQQGGGAMAAMAATPAGAPGGEGPPGGGGPMAELSVTGPDGQPVEPQNKGAGRYRSTFDVELKKPGTYRIATLNDGVFATWKENGQVKRWRGTMDTLSKDVPEKADDLHVTHAQGRVEVFVTAGKPTAEVLKTTGKGLELEPVTHPNDLFAGEAAKFRLLLDGKPAAKQKVTVTPGGIRYRTNLKEIAVETGENGEFSVTWPEPGMYYVNALAQDAEVPAGRQPRRRIIYAATLEVLSP